MKRARYAPAWAPALAMALAASGCGGGSAPASRPAAAPAAASAATAATGSWKWKLADGGELKVSRATPDRVEVVVGGVVHAATRSGGQVQLEAGGAKVATGKLKAEKVELEAGGAFYALVKNRDDKVKVYLTDPEGSAWEFKRKPDKIKVVKDEVEVGKVKFYPDDGKLKVKDAADAEVLEAKGAPGLQVGPGLVLAEKAGELDATKRNLLMALLVLIDG